MTRILHVRLVGEFRVLDDSGRDCTPRGAKLRGLVALLCLSPGRRRQRRWIEARLWSDRGPGQAAGSLRQALLDLRTAFGPGVFASDRDSVALLGVQTDLEGDPARAHAAFACGAELLEAVEVQDGAFRAWLAERRAEAGDRFRAAAVPAVPADGPPVGQHEIAAPVVPLPLVIRIGEVPAGLGGFVARSLAQAMGALVSDFAAVDVFGDDCAVARIGPQERGMFLNVSAVETDGHLHVLAALGASATGQQLWSRRSVMPLGAPGTLLDGEFPCVVFEAAEAALAAMPRLLGSDPTPLRAEALIGQAVREMFTFDAALLRHADLLLAEAHGLMPSPRVDAWRSLLRQITLIERTEPDRTQLFAEAEVFARSAMAGAPANAMVLALISQVRAMLDSNGEASAALARDAIALSPHNAFAHGAMAASLLRSGKPHEAFLAARHGAGLARRSHFLHWWESFSGITLIASGDYPAAIGHLEAAHARAPQFRPPLRHLLFLYLETGQTEKAIRVMQDLQRLEPDFSMLRMREDPDYPAGTLRRTPLLALQFPD